MSFPKNRNYRASAAGRLGSQFLVRLAKGFVIDRTISKPGTNLVKLVKAPKALQLLAKRKETL